MHLTEANMISCRSEYFLYSATIPIALGLVLLRPGTD